MSPSLPPDFLRIPVAHRALHDRAQRRPENSMPAIDAAIAAGYAIEIDLQCSADGEAVVFHDHDLDRLTHGTGPVRAMTLAQLKAVAVRDCDSPIPTLREVLDRIAGRVPLLIEIKDQSGEYNGADGMLEAATARALEGYAGPVAVMSFNPDMVARMAELAPQVARGLTTDPFRAKDFDHPLTPEQEARRQKLAAIADFDRVGASFISHDWRDLGSPRVAELKARGAGILCWTIKAPEQEATARRIADNVTFEGYAAPFP